MGKKKKVSNLENNDRHICNFKRFSFRFPAAEGGVEALEVAGFCIPPLPGFMYPGV